MLKFLRRYNKWIMVVGGSLLMIVFVTGSAIQRIAGDPMRRTVARLNGKKIRFGEQQFIALKRDAVYQFSPSLSMILPELREPPEYWMLVTREARKAGFVGETQDGPDWISMLATLEARNMAFAKISQRFGPQLAQALLSSPQGSQAIEQELPTATQILNARRSRAGGSGRLNNIQFDRSLSEARGVYRLLDSYRSAARVSDRRALQTAHERLDSALVDYTFIPADRFADDIPDPDEKTLSEHFEKYKDVQPGTGEYGIGYRQPKRLKLEWLKIDRKALSKIVKVDPIEVNKHWRQNREKYTGEWADERERVEQDLRQALTDDLIRQAQLAYRTAVLTTVSELPSDGSYRTLPDDWGAHRPTMESVAQAIVDQIQSSTHTAVPLPEVAIRTSAWLTRDDASKLPNIGASQARFGTSAISFADLAFQAKELGGGVTYGIQQGIPVTDMPLLDRDGNMYYFTILDTRNESPPDSIDEIRDQAVRDYKDIQAYKKLLAEADTYRQLALTGGLEAVSEHLAPPNAEESAEDDSESPPPLKTHNHVSVRLDRISSFDQQADTETFRNAVLAAIENIDPLTPSEEIPADDRTLVVPIQESLGLAVVRIIANRPLTVEEYRLVSRQVAVGTQTEELRQIKDFSSGNPLNYTSLAKRHHYKPKHVGPTLPSEATDEENTDDQTKDQPDTEG